MKFQHEESESMEKDDRRKADFHGIVDDVKARVRDMKDRGPRAGLQGVVEDVTRRVKTLVASVTGRGDDRVRVGETKAAAEQRVARESGEADTARADAAKQATKQRAKKA
jgi:hypothetical protein